MRRAARSSSQITEGARPEPTLPGIPDKEYFRIGEAARLVGVKPYVLRYWESEFERDIRPERSRSNQRMYRRRDVETFLEIKRLRYEEKLELPGARRQLRKPAPPPPEAPGGPAGPAPTDVAPHEVPAAEGRRHAPPSGDGGDVGGGSGDGPLHHPGATADGLAFRQRATQLVTEMADGLRDLLRIVDEDEKDE